jgi:hypothetical protein
VTLNPSNKDHRLVEWKKCAIKSGNQYAEICFVFDKNIIFLRWLKIVLIEENERKREQEDEVIRELTYIFLSGVYAPGRLHVD